MEESTKRVTVRRCGTGQQTQRWLPFYDLNGKTSDHTQVGDRLRSEKSKATIQRFGCFLFAERCLVFTAVTAAQVNDVFAE